MTAAPQKQLVDIDATPTPTKGRRGRHVSDRQAMRLSILAVSAVYLIAVLPYALLTRAWETNDELDHTKYIEYIVSHGSLPTISLANGHESHQPPLYYLIAAAWQTLLRIPGFVPTAEPNPDVPPGVTSGRFLQILHNYSPVQHQDAIYVHEIRVLSVAFGLATVILSYACARLLLARRALALSVGLFVALLPKLLVVDSSVTNDSLVITLSCLALYLFLLSERARVRAEGARRSWLMLTMGGVLGLATITKYNSLPLVGALLLLSMLPVLKRRILIWDSLYAIGAFLATTLWWLAWNQVNYGQILASQKSLQYLKAWLPPLISPVPWTNTQRFLHFVPDQLFRTVWYDGGWNQYQLPNWFYWMLWSLGALSLLGSILAISMRRKSMFLPDVSAISIVSLLAALFAGIAAVLIIAKTTTQAEGRVAFIGIAAVAILMVTGTDIGPWTRHRGRLVAFVWPMMLLAVNLYVLKNFLWPLRGL